MRISRKCVDVHTIKYVDNIYVAQICVQIIPVLNHDGGRKQRAKNRKKRKQHVWLITHGSFFIPHLHVICGLDTTRLPELKLGVDFRDFTPSLRSNYLAHRGAASRNPPGTDERLLSL